jgi:1-acyl-sn-glycerol-3-phosphate acyltransferase
MAASLDDTITRYGFRHALQEFLSHFVSDVGISGSEHIPQDGPLLIVSNHPGTIDSVAISANLPRDDLNIIAAGFPLLRRLPATSRHLIFIDPQASMNINGVRSTIQHLQGGGSVLIFPSGRVEPDPAIFTNARQALQNWSPSIELFLRKVPQTRVIVTIVSGVLSPIFLHNPLIRLWSGLRDPLAIAEVSQVITQMILKDRFRITPKISFDFPTAVDELRRDYESISQGVIAKASSLMSDHLSITNRR